MLIRRLATGFVLVGLMVGTALAADKDNDNDKDKKKEPPPPDPIMVECRIPFRPAVVLDASTATVAEIDALADRIKLYQAELKKYRDCLEPKINAAKQSGDNAQSGDAVKQYNDSVSAEEQVVDAYQAIVAKRKSIGGNPDDEATRYERCVMQVRANAQAGLQAALAWADDGGSVPAKHCAALAYLALGHSEDAAAQLQSLADQASTYGSTMRAEMFDQEGNAWIIAQRPADAALALSNAIALAQSGNLPADTTALYYADRARAYLQGGDNASAQSDLDHSIALKPTAEALALRAGIRRGLNEDKLAAADVASALALDPTYADALLERGRLRVRANDRQGARQDFLEVVTQEKDGPIVDEARKEIGALDVKGGDKADN